MTTTVDNAFIKQFEREVHEAYQRQGSKLRNTVRVKNNVKGASTTFQKVGKGEASTKTRHGDVPVMNISHTPIEISLNDYYAGDWVDKLDELKLNIDERQVVANAGAYALGRKTDSLIINALATLSLSGNKVAVGSSGLTKEKVFSGLEIINDTDVPDDGQRYAVVGAKQWNNLLSIEEFVNADYVGDANLPFNGGQAKDWLGIKWMLHTGLPFEDDTRETFIYHKNSLGFASGADVTSDITWHGDKAAHFVNNMMSQGAGLIDETGVVQISCSEA